MSKLNLKSSNGTAQLLSDDEIRIEMGDVENMDTSERIDSFHDQLMQQQIAFSHSQQPQGNNVVLESQQQRQVVSYDNIAIQERLRNHEQKFEDYMVQTNYKMQLQEKQNQELKEMLSVVLKTVQNKSDETPSTSTVTCNPEVVPSVQFQYAVPHHVIPQNSVSSRLNNPNPRQIQQVRNASSAPEPTENERAILMPFKEWERLVIQERMPKYNQQQHEDVSNFDQRTQDQRPHSPRYPPHYKSKRGKRGGDESKREKYRHRYSPYQMALNDTNMYQVNLAANVRKLVRENKRVFWHADRKSQHMRNNYY